MDEMATSFGIVLVEDGGMHLVACTRKRPKAQKSVLHAYYTQYNITRSYFFLFPPAYVFLWGYQKVGEEEGSKEEKKKEKTTFLRNCSVTPTKTEGKRPEVPEQPLLF